nr:hypothetical protein [Tanacetum cinerariifolium]
MVGFLLSVIRVYYGHIKWIEDLVPRAMWIQETINYDRNLLSMYTPRGGSSLSPSSRLWNGTTISIWIGFWSIVIQRRVEDLQLGVKSYLKRLNLTKPDTYRPDLNRREAYTAYSNPRGFIYQNKDKKNRLMRIDELYKFSDGTLNDVCNTLDDRLKGIRMQYLPTTIWRRGDKDRAAAMIQAIDKMLKTRRILRSLEKFVDGRLDGTLNDVRNSLDDRLKGIRMQYLPTTIWRRWDKDRAAAMIQAIDKMLKTRRIMRSLERFVGGRQYEGDFRML